MLKQTALLIALCRFAAIPSPLVAGPPDQHLLAVSRTNAAASAFSAASEVPIRLREVRVQVTGPYGEPAPHRLFLVFDPRSGAFCWHIAVEGHPTDLSEQTTWFKTYRAAFLRDGLIYVFTAENGPLAIFVQQSSGHATSMDDAEEQAMRRAAVLNDPPGNVDLERPWHRVLLSLLSLEFVQTPESEAFDSEPKVVNVQWDGIQWTVTLKARWTESIVLDADYKIVSMKKAD